MGSISAGDQALLRQPVDTQKSVERLYCLGFDSVWTGRINDAAITRGERSIVYDGGAMSGTFVFADLQTFDEGLEVWFGSAAGLYDRGRRRLRSMGAAEAAGTLVIDWNDDIELADDDYITIKHVYNPRPKYSWFTATGPEFRKDGPDGTTYAASGDANETPAPHVLMGRHYAAEMPAVGNRTISFDASNSVDVAGGGGGVTYAWDITPPTNASFDNDAIAAPTLTVTAAGRWWVHCTVTIDGRSTTAHRAVVVGGGITEFSRSPITCRYDRTDVECQITITSPDVGSSEIRPQVDWTDFDDQALIIITSDDWYGTTNTSIDFRDAAVYDDRHHVVYTGYLIFENADLIDDGSGAFQLNAVSMMSLFLYSQSLTGVSDATDWYEMHSSLMNVAGNLLYLFRWHSTLLDIADWWLPWSDTVLRSANEEFGEGDMVERARSLCRARIMGMTANPQGEIFVETDLNVRTAAQRGAETTTMVLQDGSHGDVAGSKRARVRRRGDLIRLLLDGGYSAGVMDTFQPYFSASQEVARAEGRPALVHLDGLMLPSQTEANRLAGRLSAIANNRYAEVNLSLSGNYREVFSPADQQWTDLGNIFAATLTANLRGDAGLVDVLCVPREVTHSHDNATGITSTSVIFEPEAPAELTGVTITPPEVPSENPGSGTYNPPGPPEWPPPGGYVISDNLLAFDGSEGCWLRLSGAADWVERNGTRTGTDDDDLQGGWDPWWFTPAKKNTTDVNQAILWACQDGKIWKSDDCGTTWVDATPTIVDDPPNDWSDAPAPTVADVTFVQRVDNIHQNEWHMFSAEWQNGAGTWRAWLLLTEDDGATWQWVSLRAASSMVTDGTYYYAHYDSMLNNVVAEARVDASNTANLAGEPDNAGASFIKTWLAGNGFIVCSIICDMGGTVTGTGMTIEARTCHNLADCPGAGCCPYDLWKSAGTVWVSTDKVAWTSIGAAWWSGNEIPTYAWGPTITWAGAHTFRYIRLRAEYAWFAGDCDGKEGRIDSVRVGNVSSTSPAVGAGELRPVWMDVDSEDGSVLYMTVVADDVLYLWKFDTADITAVPGSSALGGCTQAELAARTWYAFPFTPTFSKDVVFLAGRMDAPEGLSSPSHLIQSVDGAATWTELESGFGADYVSAFGAEGTTDNARQFYAVRSGAGVPQFYQGHETLTYRSNLSFGAGAAVFVDAMTVGPSNQVSVGSDTAAAIMIITAAAPYSSWNDITDSYPATGSVSSLTYV